MIQITMVNGSYICWNKDQYTDYLYDGKIFAVIRDSQWVGIYNIDRVQEIRIDKQKGSVILIISQLWVKQYF